MTMTYFVVNYINGGVCFVVHLNTVTAGCGAENVNTRQRSYAVTPSIEQHSFMLPHYLTYLFICYFYTYFEIL